jgi:hypothetical protein
VTRSAAEYESAHLVAVAFDSIPQESAKHIEEYVRSESANRNSRAVLVAHASPARLRKVSDQLIVRGYRPLIAVAANQAAELVERERDSIVLALIGPNLTEGTSEALLEMLRVTYPTIHRAKLGARLDGTKLQRTLDRVGTETPPEVPWDLDE